MRSNTIMASICLALVAITKLYAQTDHARSLILTVDSIDGGAVRVLVTNKTGAPLVFNSRFALSPIVGDVDLIIKNKSGSIIPAVGTPYPSMIEPKDLVVLAPYRVVGVEYPNDLIKMTYRTVPGCYSMYAVYTNKNGNQQTFKGQVKSNTIRYCVK